MSAQRVLAALNRWLYSCGQRIHDNRRGYITTMSTVVFKSQTAHIFHVGDSRVCRLRDGVLEQLTNDHSTRVSDQVAASALSTTASRMPPRDSLSSGSMR